MPFPLLLILIAVFVAIVLFFVAVAMWVRSRRERAAIDVSTEEGLDALAAELPTEWQDKRPSGGPVDEAFYRLLAESGSRLTSGAAVLVVLAFGLLGGGIPFILLENVSAAAVGVFLGGAVPFLFWAFHRWRRRNSMRKNLPEALDIVADVVRSGRGLEQAAEMVAKETTGPLSEEFGAAATQFRLGQPSPAVLAGMVRRIPLPEFKIFATAVLVHRRAGGNLPLLTERLARAARDRQEFHGHLGAVTAGSRLSAVGLVIGSMLGVFALASMQPAYYAKFFDHPWGMPLVFIAGVLQLLGIYWVYRVLKVNF